MRGSLDTELDLTNSGTKAQCSVRDDSAWFYEGVYTALRLPVLCQAPKRGKCLRSTLRQSLLQTLVIWSKQSRELFLLTREWFGRLKRCSAEAVGLNRNGFTAQPRRDGLQKEDRRMRSSCIQLVAVQRKLASTGQPVLSLTASAPSSRQVYAAARSYRASVFTVDDNTPPSRVPKRRRWRSAKPVKLGVIKLLALAAPLRACDRSFQD
jgi:hypothetical protein